jgi:hypothetical protein
MDRIDPRLVVVATFADAWHADLAAGYLIEFDIPAWVEPAAADDPFRAAGTGPAVRVLVPSDRLAEAHGLLAEATSDPSDDHGPERRGRGRPIWVYPVALLLLVGMAVTAVPASMRLPVVAIAVLGALAWRRAHRT